MAIPRESLLEELFERSRCDVGPWSSLSQRTVDAISLVVSLVSYQVSPEYLPLSRIVVLESAASTNPKRSATLFQHAAWFWISDLESLGVRCARLTSAICLISSVTYRNKNLFGTALRSLFGLEAFGSTSGGRRAFSRSPWRPAQADWTQD